MTSKIKSEYATVIDSGRVLLQTAIEYVNEEKVLVVSIIEDNTPTAATMIYADGHMLHTAPHLQHSHWVFLVVAQDSIEELRRVL